MRRMAGLTIVLSAAFMATGCTGTGVASSPQACEAAMASDMREVIAAGDKAEESSQPAECEGLSQQELADIAGKVMETVMREQFEQSSGS